jgi:hypothetical protein
VRRGSAPARRARRALCSASPQAISTTSRRPAAIARAASATSCCEVVPLIVPSTLSARAPKRAASRAAGFA